MSAAVKEAPKKTDDLADDNLLHGAHTPCQMDAPFVTLVCGRVAGWEEHTDGVGMTQCPLCWNSYHCPICGTPFFRGGA